MDIDTIVSLIDNSPTTILSGIFDEVKTTLGAHGLITPNLRP